MKGLKMKTLSNVLSWILIIGLVVFTILFLYVTINSVANEYYVNQLPGLCGLFESGYHDVNLFNVVHFHGGEDITQWHFHKI